MLAPYVTASVVVSKRSYCVENLNALVGSVPTLNYRINEQDGISTKGGANHEKQISEQDQINDQGGAKN